MKREPYLLRNIDRLGTWTRIFRFYLERADQFRAYFPEDDELNHWQDNFFALPHVSVGEWEGMKGCKVVHGPLGTRARETFLHVHNPEDGRYPWQYELYRNTELLLRTEDFTLCHIFATQEEIQALSREGVDIHLFEPYRSEDEHGPDEQPIPFSEKEVEELRSRLSRTFDDGETI